MQPAPSLLWTLEEIGLLVSNSGNPSETLSNIVRLIQRQFGVDVCSVYLLEPDRSTLVLAATVGLRETGVGRVRMRTTEGLVGLTAESVCPVVVQDAATHPRFKYFHEAGEDPYRTFVGVPIIDRGLLQGVLVVQTTESRSFSDDDVRLLASAGVQLAPTVAEARMVGHHRVADPSAAGVTGKQSVVGVGPRSHQPVPGSRSGAVGPVRPQPAGHAA